MTTRFILSAVLVMCLPTALTAETIRAIVLENATIDMGLAPLLQKKIGDLSTTDIESLGVLVTGEYHRRGYTTSYVEKLVIRRDGTLVIRVKESRIQGISVSGMGGRDAAAVSELIMPRRGEVYNRFLLQERLEAAKTQFRLQGITVQPLNYEDTGDVFLSVKVRRQGTGRFYARIGIDPIYGVSPELGYLYPTPVSSLNVEARAGYREGEFRKAESEVKYSRHLNRGGSLVLLVGARGGRRVETWESRDRDFVRFYGIPYAGLGVIRDLFGDYVVWTYFTLQGTAGRLEDYGPREIDLYDAGLSLDMVVSNRFYRLEKRDTTEFNLKAYGFRSGLRDDVQAVVSAEFFTTWKPLYWLRFVPYLGVYYTGSHDRLYWQYVYDAHLIGFFGDYTASRQKNIAALDMEFEISPRLFYTGPFVNTGYFEDEDGRWKVKTGTGIKAVVMLKNIDIKIYYGWDASGSPEDGGLYLMADGRF